jgi:hypothetical protein
MTATASAVLAAARRDSHLFETLFATRGLGSAMLRAPPAGSDGHVDEDVCAPPNGTECCGCHAPSTRKIRAVFALSVYFNMLNIATEAGSTQCWLISTGVAFRIFTVCRGLRVSQRCAWRRIHRLAS